MMEIKFILVEPGLPENVGACARAMKTMGFNDLRLINPCDYLDEKAIWLAHGSNKILENSQVYENLKEAINDLHYVIGTSSKKRSVNYDMYSIENIVEIINNKGNSINKIGIVFGKEESGLSNDQIKKCDVLSYIPMKTKYPSLNLSQAVMLYAYYLSKLKDEKIDKTQISKNQSAYLILKEKVMTILSKINFNTDSNIYNRILERLSFIGNEDINLLNSIANKILKKI